MKSNTEPKTTEHTHEEHLTPAIRVELALRNGLVIVASVLFLISIIIGHANGVLKLIAYLCGALAYVCEYLHLTEGLKVKIPHDELFMIYCFAPLYILLGLSYLIHH